MVWSRWTTSGFSAIRTVAWSASPVANSPSDALAVFEQREIGNARVQPRVVDGNARRAGERREQLFVDVGEDVAARLVTHVEVAEHLAAHADRHAEKRSHRRMIGREPVAVGVLTQVGQPQRHRIHDQQPEDAVTFRQVPDLGPVVVADADRDELREARAGVVEHPQCSVGRVDELGRRLDDAPQGVRQIEIAAHREHGIEQTSKLPRPGQSVHSADSRRMTK
jgi:hypothetical protein